MNSFGLLYEIQFSFPEHKQITWKNAFLAKKF